MQPGAAIAVGFLRILCVMLAIGLVIAIFYFLTLQKALSRCSRRNRLMEPGLVWLGLIPIFNVVWNFFIVTRVPGSLQNEFQDQDRDDGSDYGKGIGLAYAILVVISTPLGLMSRAAPKAALGLLQIPLGIASLVLFILFWVKIAGYSSRLAVPPRYPRDDREYDDYDDDYRERDDYPERGPRGDRSDGIRPDDRDRFER